METNHGRKESRCSASAQEWKDKVLEGDKEKESKLTVDYLLKNTLWRELFAILGCLSNMLPAKLYHI